MMSWVEYLVQLHQEGRIRDVTRSRIEAGHVVLCPICMGLNALSKRDVDPRDSVLQAEANDDDDSYRCAHCGADLPDTRSFDLN